MRLTIEDQQRLLSIAAEHAGLKTFAQDARAIGGHAEGEPDRVRAVFVFSNFSNGGAMFSLFTDQQKDFMTPSMLHRISAYAFAKNGLNLDRVAAEISVNNVPSQIAALKAGFQVEARLRNGAMDGADAILFSMLSHECPWMQKEQSNG